MNSLRPLQGKVLVEMLPDPKVDGSIHLPDNKKIPQQGIIRRIGPWKQAKKTKVLIAYDFRVGDKVYVDRRSWGPIVDRNIGERFRIVNDWQILAVESAS